MFPGDQQPEPKQVLAPAGQIAPFGADGYAIMGMTVHIRRDGLSIAKQAFDAFHQLAVKITGVPVLANDQCRAQILDYADRFGTLWGDDDPRTLREWKREAASFLDLHDVAKALNSADFRVFDSRIVDRGDNFGVRYSTGRSGARAVAIARPGEIIEERSAPNALSRATDFHELAKTGSSRERARMLLSREVNRKLSGGLSLGASMISESKAFVEPRYLVHLLYTRLWLSTVNGEKIERETTCLWCHEPIQGTKRRKYCDERCRTHFNNRRRVINRG